LQYIIHALQLQYSNDSVMLQVDYRCIIVGYQKQLWGVLYYLVLSVLREVTVGHISYGRLQLTEYVFPDFQVHLQTGLIIVSKCLSKLTR